MITTPSLLMRVCVCGISVLLVGSQLRRRPPAKLIGVIATPPPACPVHVVGKRIVNGSGRTVYRDPGYRAFAHEIRCSGRTVWVMFHGGAASSQEAYVVARSGDRGRTWRLVSAERYFGVNAPHEFDS